ncbi:MAG: NDP-hexose 4-ketoreductase, partial [Planctomycetaceae bacterium]|nr:NDP-hexose 4-ketoreductase [Planctomycetaceae bacterium]
AERGYALELSNDAKEFLIKKGTNLDFGARPLRRALENYVEDPLAEELLNGNFQGMNSISVDAQRDDDGKIKHLKFNGTYVEPPAPEEPEEPVGVAAGDSEPAAADSAAETGTEDPDSE